MRRAGVSAVLALSALLAAPVPAQEQPLRAPTVLVLNQDQLFDQSAFGRAAKARLEDASSALAAENREIEAALEAEERDLTTRRATLPPEEFRALAEAFNEKVEGIRRAQDAKVRSLARARDEDRKRFFVAAGPVLTDLLRESGAVMILDQASVILNLDSIDVTATAVARMDAQIGTGVLSGNPTPQALPVPDDSVTPPPAPQVSPP
jgi:Skp family chaperone for outer membrane proteins